MLVGTVQYDTVQYSTVQYSTVQYSTVKYSEFVVSVHCFTQERKYVTPRSVCHIPPPFPQTISFCHDPHTTATLPSADSHTVAGYRTDTVRTVLVMLSIYLYLQSSGFFRSGQAALVH